VPINPEYILSYSRDRVVIRNFEGKVFEYVEAGARGAREYKAPKILRRRSFM